MDKYVHMGGGERGMPGISFEGHSPFFSKHSVIHIDFPQYSQGNPHFLVENCL